MNHIGIILRYKDLFDEEPHSIDSYLYGINREILIDYAIYYCSLSTLIGLEVKNIFFAFLRECDKETEYYQTLTKKISNIVNSGTENPEILNTRTSLKFFELVKGRISHYSKDLTDIEVRQKLLKVYLLLNGNNKIVSTTENLKELVIGFAG